VEPGRALRGRLLYVVAEFLEGTFNFLCSVERANGAQGGWVVNGATQSERATQTVKSEVVAGGVFGSNTCGPHNELELQA
jgi:hypothetical protein